MEHEYQPRLPVWLEQLLFYSESQVRVLILGARIEQGGILSLLVSMWAYDHEARVPREVVVDVTLRDIVRGDAFERQ